MKFVKDSIIQETLENKGFIKVPFLLPEQVDELKDFYYNEIHTLQQNYAEGFLNTTTMTFDKELNSKVNDFVNQFAQKAVNQYFENYKFIVSTFLGKESTPDSYLPPHQDWSYVDEKEFKSYNIWICLEDATKENGNLQFLTGSHNFKFTIRTDPYRPLYFNSFLEKIPNFLIDVPTKKGEAIIFNHSTMHGSRPNISGRTRVACLINLCPTNADLYYFHWKNSQDVDIIEKYKTRPKDIINIEKGMPPPNAEFMYAFKPDDSGMSYQEFKKLCLENISYRKVISNKIKNILGK